MRNKRFITSQSGNVLTAALGVIAIIAVVGVSAYSLIHGPIRAAASVTMRSKAQVELVLTSRLIMKSGTDDPGVGAWGDNDGVIELPGFDATASAAIAALGGSGGGIPASTGGTKRDPWGTPLAYCVWDHGTTTSGTGMFTGDTTAYRDKLLLAVISAGPNRRFDTACANQPTYLTEDVDGLPDNNDDIIDRYTFEQAASSGLWANNAAAPAKIEYTQGGSVLVGLFDVLNPPTTEQFQVDGSANVGTNLIVGGTTTAEDMDIADSLAYAGDVGGLAVKAAKMDINKVVIMPASKTGIVTHLNADLLNGQHGSYYLALANLTNFAAGKLSNFAVFSDYIDGDGADALDQDDDTADSILWQVPAPGQKAGAPDDDGATIGTTVTGAKNGASFTMGSTWAVTDHDTFVANTDPGWGFWRPDLSDTSDGTKGPLGDVYATDYELWTTAKVIKLQGRDVTATAPTANQVIGWNGSAWAPMSLAYGAAGDAVTVGFTGGINFLGTSTNITSALCAANQIPKYTGAAWLCAIDYGFSFSLPIDSDGAPSSKMLFDIAAGADKMMSFSKPTPAITNNIHVGYRAGESMNLATSGGGGVFFGNEAGRSVTATDSVVYIGHYAARFATTGSRGIAVGALAASALGSSSSFIAVGFNALNGPTGCSQCIAIGFGTYMTSTAWGIAIGYEAGRYGPFNSTNTLIGMQAGYALGIGAAGGQAQDNILIGYKTGLNLKATNDAVQVGSSIGMGCGTNHDGQGQSVMIGYDISSNSSVTCPTVGALNTLIGSLIFQKSTSGHSNVVVGVDIANNQATGYKNVLMGSEAAKNTTALNENVIMGYLAARGTGGVNSSVIMGPCAGQCSGVAFSVNNVVIMGENAGIGIGTTPDAVILGASAGYGLTNSNRNVIIGDCAGCSVTSGSDNVLLGQRAGSPSAGVIFTPTYASGTSVNLTNGARNIVIGRGIGVAASNTADSFYLGNSRAGHVLFGPMTTGNWSRKGTMTAPSDRRLKHDIRPITNAWDKIKGLHGIIYKWKKWYNADNRDYLGLRAQDVKKVLPEAIFPMGSSDKMSKYMSVSYTEIIPVLIEDMKARQKRIDALKEKIAKLKAE